MSTLRVGVEESVIKEHLKTYNKVTNVSCNLIDENGQVILSEGEHPQYCTKFQQLKGEMCPCSQAHLYASKQSEKIGEPYVFFCPSGLVHWTAPIVTNGIFRGGLIGGPVQMEVANEYVVDDIIKANDFSIANKGILQAYLKGVAVVEPEKVRYLANMLYIIAKDIMSEESRILAERKKFYEGQAAINEKIQDIKEHESTSHISKYYPVELEKELVTRVKVGDKKGAKTILNELLGHVLFNNGSNLEIIKARVLELTTVLSRAAVEGGGNLEMIFGLNLKYLHQISEANSVEALCEWIVTVLERFTDSMYNVENVNNLHIIQKAVGFINDNSMNDLSLDQVADYVYLSPSYFSRLFKKEMGINFIDYLNKVRIEESKKYLNDVKMSLSDISHMVGFTDQSYYTKVFKKVEGISPGQFRKMINH
jgi:two-component system, response regulator YesN